MFRRAELNQSSVMRVCLSRFFSVKFYCMQAAESLSVQPERNRGLQVTVGVADFEFL